VTPRGSFRTLRMLILSVVVCGVFAGACANHAGASTLVLGPVTLTPTSSGPASTLLESGQTVNIAVAPNSTLKLSNLMSNGGFTGEPAMKAEECDDPGGLKANLPTEPKYHCDGSTILSTSYVNADGSFRLDKYPIYALPDSITLGESPGQKPVCGTGTNECVLYIGPNQEDFSKPHLFSAPFSVAANSNDRGASLGSSPGGAEGSVVAGVAIAASTSPSGGSAGGGILAFTGLFPLTPWVLGVGSLLFLIGAFGRRALRSRRAR
jgi:hypothetical protein